MSYANIAYNRRAVYADGTAIMYGSTNRPDFRAIEGMTDTDLNILCFWNEKDELIAMMLNVACPSQENEHYTKLDADFWGDLRPMLKEKYGKTRSFLEFAARREISLRTFVTGKRPRNVCRNSVDWNATRNWPVGFTSRWMMCMI